MKKVFFVYSDDTEDIGLYKELRQHFTAFARKGFLYIIDKDEVFRSGADKNSILELAKSSDITVPLLSVDYINSDECLKMLESAVASQKEIIPVLLRECEWDEVDGMKVLQNNILPDGHSSVTDMIARLKSGDAVFTQIARRIKAVVLNDDLKILDSTGVKPTNNTYYYLLASIVLVIGGLMTAISYTRMSDWKISAVIFLLFSMGALFALKNVLFPARLITG